MADTPPVLRPVDHDPFAPAGAAGPAAPAQPVLRPVDFDPFASEREPSLPLTEPQAEMWAAAAMGPEANCSYNQCFALELVGRLRVDSLRTALDRVIARHDGLRAVFAPDGRSQTIRAPFGLELPLVDLSALEPAARAAELEALLEREGNTPFDLAEGPLLRALVVRESADRHRFVLTTHHIVCDGWSSMVMFSDLGRLYVADCLGVDAQLGAVSSYRAYVEGQTSYEGRAASTADEDEWAAQYPDGAPVLDLPLARRPALKTYRSGRAELPIDNELYTAVRLTGARSGATLFATLLATYEVLLMRVTGQQDLVVGVPLAGQQQLENPALVAHCVNTVPMRAKLDPDIPFADYVRGVGQQLAWAQDHSQLTFGSLVRRLGIPRDPSRTPLVQATLSIDKAGAPFDFGELSIASIVTPKSFSNFELAVNLVDNGSDILVECDYNADLFTAETVERWLSHYESLLRGIVAQPADPIGALPLVSLPEAGAAVAPPAAAGGTLHGRFSEQVVLGPDRVAAVCDGLVLSYGELDRRANGLALVLRGLGVGPDVLVGLRTDRSLDVVVGILGILKAGGAYLPLDPAYPRDRVEFMLSDSGVDVVVAGREFAGDFEVAGVQVVVLDDSVGEASVAPEVEVGPGSLAYVIYTSGSTGRPKGVLISHGNVTRLFDATDAWFGFGEDDVWTLFHSYAFDFSVWELWGALLYGGRVVVVPYWVSRSPEEFRELVGREGVTVLNQTPSAFRQFVAADADAGGLLGSLRYVIFGGEALELSSLRPWFERYGDSRPQLVNMYGITETTVHVTYRPVGLADLEAGLGSVIGVPIPDLSVTLLDPYGQPVPVGVAGELYVGGAGVSRGYLNRPELTAERFVADRLDGARTLYRSGDLARRLESGELEYLGRIDDQVKIRGFRIELGEIEAQLNGLAGVAESAVVVREDVPGDRRLVAYVVARAGADEGLVEVSKSQLRAQLPEYMVPAHFVLVEGLPLTANGKLDRKALPAPSETIVVSERPYVAPRTATEEIIAGVWSAVLRVPEVSIDDNFFELGGDSLMAVQVVTDTRNALGSELAMRHLFERPTVAGLAEMADLIALAAAASPAGAHPHSSDQGEREEIEL